MGRTRSNPVAQLHLVGHEAGALAPWLHRELQARGLPMVLLETRHAAAALEAQRNKTDKNDARGLAQLVRSGRSRSVHVKSEESYRLKLLLTSRRLLKRKLVDIENEMRQSLKAFGLLLGPRVQRACAASARGHGGRPQARGDHASNVARRDRVPLRGKRADRRQAVRPQAGGARRRVNGRVGRAPQRRGLRRTTTRRTTQLPPRGGETIWWIEADAESTISCRRRHLVGG